MEKCSKMLFAKELFREKTLKTLRPGRREKE